MSISETIVSYETAKLAKEKKCDLILFGNGFEYTDKDGNEYWTSKEKGISGKEKTTPVIECCQSLLQKWLREKHNIHIIIRPRFKGNLNNYNVDYSYNGEGGERNGIFFSTYEEALEKALNECLKLI